MTIGEASFNNDDYRGQIRVYERLSLGSGYQEQRRTNQGYAPDDHGRTFNENTYSTPKSFGSGFESYLGSDLGTKGPAGIGAGAEEHQQAC